MSLPFSCVFVPVNGRSPSNHSINAVRWSEPKLHHIDALGGKTNLARPPASRKHFLTFLDTAVLIDGTTGLAELCYVARMSLGSVRKLREEGSEGQTPKAKAKGKADPSSAEERPLSG
jgi:hypothetical protein